MSWKPRKRQLHFETLRESRKGYYVQYDPAGGDLPFAWLTLTFPKPTPKKTVALRMEDEARIWLKRYPVPLMVFASDEKGDVIHFGPEPTDNHLFAWHQADNGEFELRWGKVSDDEMPDYAYSLEYLKHVYAALEYKTLQEVRSAADAGARKRARDIKLTLAVVAFWGIGIPLIISILGFANPAIGAVVFASSLIKGLTEIAKLFGLVKPTEDELARREEERRMHFHHYHCERNPDGFLRLLIENIEQDERERIRCEAEGVSK